MVFIEGYEAVFKLPADQGDQDFVKYDQLLQENTPKYKAANIEEGLQRVFEDRTVLHTSDAALRGV